LGAKGQRRRYLPAGADAAGRQHRRPTSESVDDLRPQHHRPDLAGVSPGLMPLRDNDVDTVVDMALCMFGAAGERGQVAALADCHSRMVTVDAQKRSMIGNVCDSLNATESPRAARTTVRSHAR